MPVADGPGQVDRSGAYIRSIRDRSISPQLSPPPGSGGSADPDCGVQTYTRGPGNARADEHLLADLGPQALAEQVEPGPLAGWHRHQTLDDAVDHDAGLLGGTVHLRQGQGRREHGVLDARGRAVPAGEVLEGLAGHVVDVAGPGGGEEGESRPLEGPGAVDLGQQQRGTLLRAGSGIERGVHPDRLLGRLTDDVGDCVGRQRHRQPPGGLPGLVGPGDRRLRAASDLRQ